MQKILISLASLTLLASCTLGTPASPVIQKDTMMKPDVMKMGEKMMSGAMTPTEMAKMEMTKSMSGMSDMKDNAMKMGEKMMSGAMTPEAMKAMEAGKMMMSGSAMKPESMKMDDMKKDMMMKPTGYALYDEASVKSALASGQKVVLFFHAPWCPTCKALDSAIRSELTSIPADTLIVKVDYDTSEMLKKKY